MRHLIVALLASVLIAPALRAAPVPKVRAQSIDQLARPLPLPYDTAANAHAQLGSAIEQAKREHRLLLIDLGGNWCPDCRVLAGVMALPEVKAFLDAHYVVLNVDIGHYDKNQDIAARFGASGEKAVPVVLVVDPVSGRLVNAGHTLALADARRMTPQALADWLAQWV